MEDFKLFASTNFSETVSINKSGLGPSGSGFAAGAAEPIPANCANGLACLNWLTSISGVSSAKTTPAAIARTMRPTNIILFLCINIVYVLRNL